MREDLALELYKRAVGVCHSHDENFRPTHPTTQQGFYDFIHDVSNLLEAVGMEVKRGREDVGRGKGWVVLVNNDPNDVALHASDLTPLELAYYRDVIQAIITSYPANSIGSTQALRITSEGDRTMTRVAAESLLGALTSRAWLTKSQRGRYSLAPRAMMELETYLRQEYEGYVQQCKKCEGVVMTGIVCDNGDCDTHLHGYCHDNLRRSNRDICPGCKVSFADRAPRPIGEEAVPRAEDNWRGFGEKKRKRASQGVRAEEDGDEVEDELEDELEDEEGDIAGASMGSVGAGPTTWTASRSRRSMGTVIPETQHQDDDGEDEDESSPPARRRR